MTLKERLLAAIAETPGLTDRELADRLLSPGKHQAPVNQTAHSLEAEGVVSRVMRADGKIGNYPASAAPAPAATPRGTPDATDGMSEDQVKAAVAKWLEDDGWNVLVRWGHERGIDIEATREEQRWVIEAKGCGSRQPMRVNYFIGMLGETLQRMDDPCAHYSIALPDMQQYRGLWQRLPALAKARTTISLLLVDANGSVAHHEG